jgi:hypothetical protein
VPAVCWAGDTGAGEAIRSGVSVSKKAGFTRSMLTVGVASSRCLLVRDKT